MANHTFVELDLDEAQLLGDLAGIRQDLQDAQRFARRLGQVLQPESYDSDLVDSLSTAMLVRYARAFSPGVRKQLGRPQLDRLSAAHRASHEKFNDWRSKHVAHSVNFAPAGISCLPRYRTLHNRRRMERESIR